MEDNPKTKPQESVESYTLSRDELLTYIELNLWSRFQGRMWQVVGAVLTIVTVGGLLGIPYYIKTQVDLQLVQRAKEFQLRSDEIITHAKLLAIMTARYESERQQLDADIFRIVSAIPPEVSKQTNRNPSGALIAVASSHEFSPVVDGALITKGAWDIPPELKGKSLFPATMLVYENRGLAGGSGYEETHPVRNGTYQGCIRDIRFRIVLIEALHRAIGNLQKTILELGGASDAERRVEAVKVSSLKSSEFADSLTREMAKVSDKFLNEEEKREFARVRDLYTPGLLP